MNEEFGAQMNEYNGKGVLHVALTLASKFFLDRYEKDTIFYGVVQHINKRQMRQMTDYFLELIDFRLYITEKEFEIAKNEI